MKCSVCSNETAADRECPWCGTPSLPGDAPRSMVSLRAARSAGELDGAIGKLKSLARDNPASLAVRLALAVAFHRRAKTGVAALSALAEREFDAARKLAPVNYREAGLAVMEAARETGNMDSLRAWYKSEEAGNPVAKEMLGIMDAVGTAPGVSTTGSPGGRRMGVLVTAAVSLGALLLAGLWFLWGGRGFPAGMSRGSVSFDLGKVVPSSYLGSGPSRPPAVPFHPGAGEVARSVALTGHAGGISAIAFSPDGKWLVSAGDDMKVRCWSVDGGAPVSTELAGSVILSDVAFSPLGDLVVATDNGGMIFAMKFKDGVLEPLRSGESIGDSHSGHVAFSPNGKLLAVAVYEGKLALVDIQNEKVVSACRTSAKLRRVSFSPDGRYLLYGTAENYFGVWDLAGGRVGSNTVSKVAATADLTGLSFSGDGRTLAIGFMDSSIIIWDFPSRKERFNFYVRDISTFDAAMSPDGNVCATAGQNGKVYLWNANTANLITTLGAHEGWARCVSFSPAGDVLASAGVDGAIYLWK